MLERLRLVDRGSDERGEVGTPSGAVLLADGDGEARGELARLLESAGYRVVQVSRGDEAIVVGRSELLSLAILEIPLEVLSGYEVCRALKSGLGPTFPVLFVSGQRTESYDRVAGLLVGADDYLVKPYAADELLARVRLLAPLSRAARGTARSTLTPREDEVLRLLAQGMTQREIAAHLTISPKTVGTHIENVLRKLGVHSRAQAVARAFRADGAGVLHEASQVARPGGAT